MDKMNPEEMLEKLNQIYLEREKQFSQWEKEHERKREQLKDILEQIEKKRKENEQETVRLAQLQESLERKGEELDRREKEFARLYTELENMRSEVLKLKMEAENYDFERAIHGEGTSVKAPDLTQYILRTEHEKLLAELQEKVSDLQKERIRLLKNSLGMEENKDLQTEPEAETAEQETGDVPELTAMALKDYLNNGTGIEKTEQKMNNGSEEIRMKRNGIIYSFLFTFPPSFTILTDTISQEQRDRVITKYPEIQISTKEDRVLLTGYFTNDISPENLTNRVFDIGRFLEGGQET